MSKGEVSRSNYDGYEQFIGDLSSIMRSNIYKILLNGELTFITNDIPSRGGMDLLERDVKKLIYFPFQIE
jgi:hypothetical protein